MKKKQRRPRTPTDYKPVGFAKQFARIAKDAAGIPKDREPFWEAFIPILMELLQAWIASCEEKNADRVARLLGRPRLAERLMRVNLAVDEIRGEGHLVRRGEIRRFMNSAQKDARQNPKDTAASVRELRGE